MTAPPKLGSWRASIFSNHTVLLIAEDIGVVDHLPELSALTLPHRQAQGCYAMQIH